MTQVGDSNKAAESALRGRAIEMFGSLERALDSAIASYYVPRQPLMTHFFLDLLSSEHFSYGLRRSVFEAIVRRHGWYDERRMQHLHRAGRWRNFLAHVAGMESHDYSADDTLKKIGYADPRPPNNILTIQEAFEKFEPECTAAQAYVAEAIAKITPVNMHLQAGHIVENPIAPEDTYEDWLDGSSNPDT